MRVLYDIQDLLEDELKKIVKKEDITTTDLDSIYKMVDIVKDTTTIEAMKKQSKKDIQETIPEITQKITLMCMARMLVEEETVTEMADTVKIILIVEVVMLWVVIPAVMTLTEIVHTTDIADIVKKKWQNILKK